LYKNRKTKDINVNPAALVGNPSILVTSVADKDIVNTKNICVAKFRSNFRERSIHPRDPTK
jgi:hypothetical protein